MGSSTSKSRSNSDGTVVDAPDTGKSTGPSKTSAASKKSPSTKASKAQPSGNGDSVVEVTVCKVDDLKDGEMREVDVGSGKALLVKQHGIFSAIGHKCTHYGAPLIKGVLCNGRIRCPWHGACFNATTGDIEDFPGLDSVAKYEVSPTMSLTMTYMYTTKQYRSTLLHALRKYLSLLSKGKQYFLINLSVLITAV